MPTYDDSFIRERVTDSKDAGRAAGADRLAARIRAGDQAALQQLMALSGDDSTGGWATNDARNYGRMVLRDLGYGDGQYAEARDGQFSLGKTLGGIARIAAPIAGALIPGVGTLGAMAIGGLGNAAGNLASGRGLQLGESLLAGGAAAAGNKLLGNGLGSTPGAMPGMPGGAPGARPPGAGNMTQAGTAPGGATPGAPGGGLSSVVDRYGQIGSAIQKWAPLGVGILGGINQAGAQSSADDMRNRGVDIATQDWQSRAGVRQSAVARAMAPLPARVSLGNQLADPTDPYARGN